MRPCLQVVLSLLALVPEANAFPQFQKLVPNGAKVTHPCNKSDTWEGVGHEIVQGQGPLNPFGRDFFAKDKQWSVELCKMDSDGDGKTNGEELGDPTCKWTSGQPNPASVVISHPGVCDPVDSPKCQGKNHFLNAVDSCLAILNITKQAWCPGVSDSTSKSIKTLELTFNRTVLPANDTVYLCQTFTVPADQDYHIVAWEPLIDNFELMHHLVLFTCNTPLEETKLAKSKKFISPERCGMTPSSCQNMAAVWAFGQVNRCYNNRSGVLMGNSSFRQVIIQIHYNNPSLKANIVDSSGIRLYYTPKLRPEHTTMITLGQLDFAIPPGSKGTKVGSPLFTTPNCSQQFLGAEKYRLTSLLFHMHKMGSHAKLVLTKASGNKSITIIDEDVTYDRPKFLVWQANEEAPLLEAGDNLQMECTFSTVGMNDFVFFGERTTDEMCMIFMEIFPRPLNMSYLPFFTVDDTNTCTWMKSLLDPTDKTPIVVKRCPLIPFAMKLQKLANSTEGGYFRDNCPAPREFPAKTCPTKCATFLKENNFTGPNPCMEGSTFRSQLGLNPVGYGSYEGVYHAQSMIDLCRSQARTGQQLNPSLDTTTKSGASATATYRWALMITMLAGLFIKY